MKYHLSNDGTTVFIQKRGGMITAQFDLDGRKIEPFYQAPWASYTDDPLLTSLRGDFICAPFGMSPASMEEFPADWAALDPGKTTYPHGYSANVDWSEPANGVFNVVYPEGQPIESITRHVVPERERVVIEDRMTMRETASFPIGLHPILRLPKKPHSVRLRMPVAEAIFTYPVKTDDRSVLVPNAKLNSLENAPLVEGGSIDLTSLPLNKETEELVGVFNVEEPVVIVENLEEKYRVKIEWDAAYFKHCLLWFSNYGRQSEPWSGRNLGLGIEPITGAFDLGTSISVANNPLRKRGFQTAVQFEAGETYTIKHSISVERL